MSYDWENSGRAQRKKVKKTGTVVLHTDAAVDRSLDRLTKMHPLERTTAPSSLVGRAAAEAAAAAAAAGAGNAGDNEDDNGMAAQLRGAAAGATIPLLTPETAERLQSVMGFTELLPCQAQCYRGIFKARDVILHSRTGSGKTLAYALPVIERHLILGSLEAAAKEKAAKADAGSSGDGKKKGGKGKQQKEDKTKTEAPGSPASPFMLIFVFSNDLAVQTQGVLRKLYPQLHIMVAGCDAITDATPVDILIGSVRTIDECVRGHRAAAAADAQESKARARAEAKLPPQLKGGRNKKRSRQAREAEEEDDDDAVNQSSDDEHEGPSAAAPGAGGGEGPRVEGVVSAAGVRCVVVDEVDTTLGPRYSGAGRRMKTLLKEVRRANGALTDGLLSDFRAHHYVLCGATIPNWVIKAGFLGVKKYYYQLVPAGEEKLPAQLRCWSMRCPPAARVAATAALLQHTSHRGKAAKGGAADDPAVLGRTVVFGTNSQLARLAEALAAAKVPARLLSGARSEAERIAALDDFNAGRADVLLATDLAARGLDLAAVRTVVMLALPPAGTALAAETFVHRAGRSARVGREGQCLVLCDATEAAVLDGIAKSTHVVLHKFPVPPAVAAAAAAAAASNTSPGAGAAAAGSSNSSKKNEKSTGASDFATVRFVLTVRDPFRFRARPAGAPVPPAAAALLRQTLADELAAGAVRLSEAEASKTSSSPETAHFECDSAIAHEVRKKLWRYDVKEL